MKLELKREILTPNSTIGSLKINGIFECYTLEDVVRTGAKVWGQTAIQAGTYEITITYSNKFKQYMPLLMSVPNFSGIRIHSGNTASNTEGCILVGSNKSKNFIGGSRTAYARLFSKIKKAIKTEKVFITIS